ncbi:hypothetical protein ABPG73_000259 [Tetrahymena malaccensis]
MIISEKLPANEENDNLAQNMIAQNSMIHKFLNNQSQAKSLGDSSLVYPQTLNNFDNNPHLNQDSKLQGFDLSESQQQFYQFKKLSYPNMIYDSRRASQLKNEINFHKQLEYPSSSRSINLESIEDFQRFNMNLSSKSQYSIRMKAHATNQSKVQIKSKNLAQKTLCPQNKQHLDCYDKNKLQTVQVESQIIQNQNKRTAKRVLIADTEDKITHSSKDKYENQKDSNLFKKFLSIKIRNEDNSNSIKFEKAIQIIKRLLPNKDNFKFRIQQKVKYFIEQLNLYYSNRNLKSKYQQIVKTIGDKSSYHYENSLFGEQNSTKNKKLSNLSSSQKFQYQLAGYFYKKLCCIMSKNVNLPLIMPANPYLLAWDSIYLVIINSFLYIYSIYCFFGSQTKEKNLGISFYIIFITLALDRVIKFNTAFYEKDVIISKRQKIIEKNIFSFEFLIDLLVTAVIFFKLLNQSIDSMTYNSENQIFTYFINCFVFLLIYRNEEKKKILSDVIAIEQNQKHLYRLFTQLLNVFLIAHISAICMWVLYLVEEHYQITNNWVNQANIQNQAFYEQFMNRKNINSSLKSRVKFYLNFLASEQKNRDKNEEDLVLGLLSNKLRNEIIEEINYKIINKYSLFMVNFQSKVIKEVVYLMEEMIVAPNEIIFNENDTEDQSIYFIQNGEVEIFVADVLGQPKKVLAQITSDNVFGEISFFSGLPRTASARSLNLSTIYKINRQKFICFLQNYQEDFERYKMIQEQIICQNNLLCLYIKCYTCNQAGHIAANCPMSHINIQKQFQILKNNYSIFQERKQLTRKKKCLNFLSFVKNNKLVCKNIKLKYRYFNSQTQLLYQQSDEDQDYNQLSGVSHDSSSQTTLQSSSSSIEQKKDNLNPTTKRLSLQIVEQMNHQKLRKQISQSILLNNYNQEIENKKCMKKFSKNQIPELNEQQNIDKNRQNDFDSKSLENCLTINDFNLGFEKNVSKSHSQVIDQDSSQKQPSMKSQNSLSNIQMEQMHKDIYQDDCVITNKQSQNDNDTSEVAFTKQNIYIQDGKSLKAMNVTEIHSQLINELERQLFCQKRQISRENEALQNNNFNQISSQINFSPQAISNNYQLNPRKNILVSYLPRLEQFTQQNKIEQFDLMKIFKRFFPHNNFDKVLKKLKLVNIQNSKLRKQDKRQSRTTKLNNQQQIKSIFTSKDQNIQPTYASYGIFISNRSQFPIKFS